MPDYSYAWSVVFLKGNGSELVLIITFQHRHGFGPAFAQLFISARSRTFTLVIFKVTLENFEIPLNAGGLSARARARARPSELGPPALTHKRE